MRYLENLKNEDATARVGPLRHKKNKSSFSQKFRSISWHLKVHHRFHKPPLLVLILRLTNAVHMLPSFFCKSHSNITLSSTTRSKKDTFLHVFPPSSCMHISSPLYLPCEQRISKQLQTFRMLSSNSCTSYRRKNKRTRISWCRRYEDYVK